MINTRTLLVLAMIEFQIKNTIIMCQVDEKQTPVLCTSIVLSGNVGSSFTYISLQDTMIHVVTVFHEFKMHGLFQTI